MNKDLLELLMKENELNEHYHDSKENKIWLGCTLFYTYSIFIIAWIINPKHIIQIEDNVLIFLLVLFAIDVLAFWFIKNQTDLKLGSVEKTRRIYDEMITKLPNRQMENALRTILKHDKHCSKSKYNLIKNEVILMLIMGIFSCMKIIIVLSIAKINPFSILTRIFGGFSMDSINWEAIGAVASAVGSFGIIIAVIQFRASAWLKAQEIFTNPEFVNARTNLFSIIDSKTKDIQDVSNEDKILICKKMDEIAHLRFAIGPWKTIKTWGNPIAKAWKLLEKFVEDTQGNEHWEDKWKSFSKIGKHAIRRNKKLIAAIDNGEYKK